MAKISDLYHLIQKRNDPELNVYLDMLKNLAIEEKIVPSEEITTEEITTSDKQMNLQLEELKKLLESNEWPAAVDPALICDQSSETDKVGRAEGILELLIENNLNNKKFLDYGCGEGHIPFKALDRNTTISVGYDIKEDPHWNEFKKEGLILTTDMKAVEAQAPYDVILIYDVLDHTTSEDAQGIMLKAKELLADAGVIYLRTHPFCSRHATHLYHKINKAFIHLVFTPSELNELGYESPTAAEVMFPMWIYSKYIKKAQLQVVSSNVLRERVEDFFRTNLLVRNRIKSHYPKLDDQKFPDFQCEQQFLDYVLKK